jgi:hypothetical protein
LGFAPALTFEGWVETIQIAMKLSAMKNWLRVGGLRVIGAFLCIAVIFAYRSVSSHFGWVSVSSSEGGFEMEFPTKPEQQTVTGRMNDPRFQNAAFFVAQKDNVGYEMAYSDDFPDTTGSFNVEKRLDAARDGCLEATQGGLVSEITITKSGATGREIRFLVNGVRCRARIYILGARRYILEVFPDNNSSDSERFFDSFRLVKS